MKSMVSVNGKVTEAGAARIPVLDRGLLLGDALFETLRVKNGWGIFFSEHFVRLFESASLLGIALPLNEKELHLHVRELCLAGELDDATVRITLTRGAWNGSLSIPEKSVPTVIVMAMPVVLPAPELYEKGVEICLDDERLQALTPGGKVFKTTNYLSNILAKNRADEKGCYDALLRGSRGELAEITTANFFCVRNGVVETPSLESGILPGITRNKVLQLLAENNIPFCETDIFPKDIQEMEEAFLVSSIRGILPIFKLEAREMPAPASICRRLSAFYGALLCSEIVR